MLRRLILLAACLGLTGCSHDDGRTMKQPTGQQQAVFTSATTLPATSDSGDADVANETSLTITPGWDTKSPLPTRFTCDGSNVSPGFSWTGEPAGTVTFAVILSDTDSPTYSHWTVANIPANVHLLAENWIPPLAVTAANARGAAMYTGPCPPKGSTHHYVLSIYAVTQQLEATKGDPAEGMRTAIQDAASDMASFNFAYSR